ncbi:MAG: EAL domain-containing protein [Gemmatimonadota bacterium]
MPAVLKAKKAKRRKKSRGSAKRPATPTRAKEVETRRPAAKSVQPATPQAALDPAAALAASFRRALDGIWFAYQPVVDSRFQIVGYEALLRSEEQGLHTALPLLDTARRLERSDDLLLQMWTQAPQPFGPGGLDSEWLFMNVEPSELVVFRDLARGGPFRALAPRIVIEITERAALLPHAGLDRAAVDLKAMGFRVAIDDFGGAYTGIATFAALEPDLIKLDGQLIRGIDRSRHRQLYVRKLLEMCDELGTKVVAEEVETPAEFEALCDVGCQYLQGFYVGRPEALAARPSD